MKEKLYLPRLKPALTLEKFLSSTWELQVREIEMFIQGDTSHCLQSPVEMKTYMVF